MRWTGWALLAALLGWISYALLGMHGHTREDAARREDANSLRQIAAVLLARSREGRLPMKDGALDVLLLVKRGDLSGGDFRMSAARAQGKARARRSPAATTPTSRGSDTTATGS